MEEKIEKSFHNLSVNDKQAVVRALISDIVILSGEIELDTQYRLRKSKMFYCAALVYCRAFGTQQAAAYEPNCSCGAKWRRHDPKVAHGVASKRRTVGKCTKNIGVPEGRP